MASVAHTLSPSTQTVDGPCEELSTEAPAMYAEAAGTNTSSTIATPVARKAADARIEDEM